MRDRIWSQARKGLAAGSFAGILIGLAGVGLQAGVERVYGGRLLGDPTPTLLAAGAILRSVRRGFLYFRWQDPLRHLGFLFALSFLATSAAGRSHPGDGREARATIGGRWAAGLPVLAAAAAEIDALAILLHYAISGLISVGTTGWLAARLSRLLPGWGPDA